MSKLYKNDLFDDHPVAGCFGFIVLLALVIFLGPWVVMHAWSLIAVGMFGLPAMPYWTAFWGTWAMHIIFSRTTTNTKS